jgi:hypothetical protein
MKFSELPLNPTPRVLRQFAAAWLVVFLTLAFKRGLLHTTNPGIALALISLIGVIGLILPRALRWLFVVASIIAFPIGWVVTQLVLVLMFFLVLTPLALFFRLRGRDALQLRRQPGKTSFWVAREQQPPPEKYLKQF